MGRRVLLTAVLLAVSGTVSASPAFGQVAPGAPPPPEYRVNEDGTLVIGGDILIRCAEVGLGDPYQGTDDPTVRAGIDRSLREYARACEAAGFPTAVDAASGSASASTGTPETAGSATATPSADAPGGGVTTLPDTGGSELHLLLMAGGVLLTAFFLAFRIGH